MKTFFVIFLVSFTAKASDNYYLDIYDSRTDKNNVEIVFSYKGCEDRLVVNKKDLENTKSISKWLKSLKKMRDEGIGCVH